MSDATHQGRRAKRMALVVVGGAVVLTTVMAPVAAADEITVQDSTVINAGAAGANSGGNVAIGNASTNVAATGQGAAGGVASNRSTTNNTSNGTGTIETGAATATGSAAENDVYQGVNNDGDDDGGLGVHVQDSDVVNAGAGFSNSGGNAALGNISTNIGATGQGAVGGLATNHSTTNNTSDGEATIYTGPANAIGTASSNDIAQSVATDVEDGLSVLVQDADVINFGIAGANSGGNLAIGNASLNVAATGQGAAGLIASNNATSTNDSDGTARVITGPATATGNAATNYIDQQVGPDDPGFLAVMFQDAFVANLGAGVANSGINAVIGNVSGNFAFTGQGLAGLIASNVSNTLNDSDGLGYLKTGKATGIGNEAINDIQQNG